MSTRSKLMRFAGVAFLCSAALISSSAGASERAQRKAKKPPLAPLPSGPTGPVPQMPLDSIAAVPPQVTYQNGQLTIIAPNSTLADILKAVKKQTGAEIEIPQATDRVVTRLGPGPARDVMADLLNGSKFNYVLLGSPQDAASLTRVVLVAKSGGNETNMASNTLAQPPQQVPPNQPVFVQPAPENDDQANADQPEEPAPDENNGDQPAAEAEQQNQDQNGVKTPQQMLQEMQQRQMQLQQMQQPGQPPVPGSGMPPHPPQEP